MSHSLRRFYLQRVESILEDTKKGPVQLDKSLRKLCMSIIYSSTAAWAAARRAMGTRNGEQLT